GVLVVARGGLAVLLACWHFLSLWSSRPSRASHCGSGLRPLRTCTRYRVPRSALDGYAHRAGGALDDLHRRLDVVGVEVGHLDLGDLAHLGGGHLAHLHLV